MLFDSIGSYHAREDENDGDEHVLSQLDFVLLIGLKSHFGSFFITTSFASVSSVSNPAERIVFFDSTNDGFL